MVSQETLASYLKEQILAERMCAARMTHVLKSERLEDGDRRDLERLVRDEQRHAQWLTECASIYPKIDGYPGTWAESIWEHTGLLRDLSPEQMIVTIYLPERLAVRTINRQVGVFRQAGDTCSADTYEQILGEERRHVEITGRILRHFLDNTEPGFGGKVRDFYHRALSRRFRKYHFDFLRSRA